MNGERIGKMRLMPISMTLKNNCSHYIAKKASLDSKAEDYVGKNFKFNFNFNPYHYAIIDIKEIDAVIDSDDTKKKIPLPLI